MPSTMLSLLNAEDTRAFYEHGAWQKQTIYDVALAHARNTPDRPAIRDRFRKLSFGALVTAADAFAGDLAARGVRPGQRVAIWMPDRIESAVALLACSRHGYVFCPSPHRNHTVAEVVALLERMRAAILICQSGFGADAGKADLKAELRRLGSLRHTYEVAPYTSDPGPPFADAMTKDAGPPPAPVGDPDRVSYIAFTSGTTGAPKGVMHSDNTQLVTARAITKEWRLGGDTVVYSLSPFSHNLGMGSLLTSLVAGAEFVIHDIDRRRDSLVDRLIETETTYLIGVPTHAQDLLAEMQTRKLDRLGKVGAFRISGAAAPKNIFSELHAKGIVPQSGYGMTETNAHQYTRPDDALDLITDSCGRVCPGYEIKIFDRGDPDKELPFGEIGVVAGRGACLMLGYFDDQISTESAFNTQGWFMTGDLGWIDAQGYLRLTGRIKDVIIRGGHNINPERIEELAMRHPSVERAAVVPVPDTRLGEKACLAVMFTAGAPAAFGSVLAFLAEQGLSKYDMPEYGLALDHIPLFSNGKIEKREILTWIDRGSVTPTSLRTETQEKEGT